MKITVISDTHGILKENLKELLAQSSHVIHAGDIGSLGIYRELKSLNPNTYFVKGNCDRSAWAASLPETLLFHLDGILFYVIHNRSSISFRPEQADIIISGHTHCYLLNRQKDKIYLNPGSCGMPRDGMPPSCAVITTENGKLIQIERLAL